MRRFEEFYLAGDRQIERLGGDSIVLDCAFSHLFGILTLAIGNCRLRIEPPAAARIRDERQIGIWQSEIGNENSGSNEWRRGFFSRRGDFKRTGPRAGRFYDAVVGPAAWHQRRRKRRSASVALLFAG